MLKGRKRGQKTRYLLIFPYYVSPFRKGQIYVAVLRVKVSYFRCVFGQKDNLMGAVLMIKEHISEVCFLIEKGEKR